MAGSTRITASAVALTKYVQTYEQVLQLQAELEALRPAATRYVKSQKKIIEDDKATVRCESRRTYRYSERIGRIELAIKNMQQSLVEEQEREISIGRAVETGRQDTLTVIFKSAGN